MSRVPTPNEPVSNTHFATDDLNHAIAECLLRLAGRVRFGAHGAHPVTLSGPPSQILSLTRLNSREPGQYDTLSHNHAGRRPFK